GWRAYSQFKSPSSVKFAHRNDSIAPSRRHPLQSGVKESGRNWTALLDCESVGGMHDHRYVCQAGRQPPDETRFGRVSVNDSVGITPQKIAQANEAAEIPYWAYLASDNIQVHQAWTTLY